MELNIVDKLAKELYGYVTLGWEMPDPDELAKLINDFLKSNKAVICVMTPELLAKNLSQSS